MPKKLEFYEGEEARQRVAAVMKALVSPKPSSLRVDELSDASPKSHGDPLKHEDSDLPLPVL